MHKALLVLVALVVVGCVIAFLGRDHFFVTEAKAMRATRMINLTNVRVEDRDDFFVDWNGCGGDDNVSFEMAGKDSAGQEVEFVVCCGGIMKGCTVRTE